MYRSTGYVAKKYNVTRECVVNWINEDKFDDVKRTKGGHYRIWINNDPVVIGYTRVSSKKQESSLKTQQQQILTRYPNAIIISDVGGGFNFKRRGFISILERAIEGDQLVVVATTSDRITRTGFHLCNHIIELSGGRIELLEEKIDTEGFDFNQLVGFITSFCNSQYGKRSHRRKPKNQNLSK